MTAKVTIRTADRRHTLTAVLGATQPSMTDGRGGWSEVARPRRPAVVEWTGPAARKASVEILLDEWRSGKSISPALTVVNALAPQAPTAEPPALYVVGSPMIPAGIPWVAQGVTFTDWLEHPNGWPARVTVTFDLLERQVADVVTRSSPAKRSSSRNGTAARGQARTYVMRSGDTLSGVAAKTLGSASRASEIAKLNGLRLSQKIKVGYKLQLPPK